MFKFLWKNPLAQLVLMLQKIIILFSWPILGFVLCLLFLNVLEEHWPWFLVFRNGPENWNPTIFTQIMAGCSSKTLYFQVHFFKEIKISGWIFLIKLNLNIDFLSPFGGPIASYWNYFGYDVSPLSGQKWPKYPQIMYSCTGHKYTTVGGAFVGHFGIIWVIWGPLGGPIARF